MDPIARQQAIADAEAHLAALGEAGDPVAPDGAVDGYAVCWNSTALGARGPTRVSPDPFGRASFRVPLLWAHDETKPVGSVVLTPDGTGLKATGRISNTATGRDAITLLQDGGVNGLSIGFTTATSYKDADDGARIVTRPDIDEVSIVVHPADRSARVSSVGGRPVPTFHAADPRERERATRRADVLADVEAAASYARSIGLDIPGIRATSPGGDADATSSARWFYESLETFDTREKRFQRETAKRAMEVYAQHGLTPLAAMERNRVLDRRRGAW